MQTPATGAVVLTGGGGVRLGGADKAGIELGGRTLLEHQLAVLGEAGVGEVVVVGPEVSTSRPVTFRREDPPDGGPAAGLLAGLTGFPRVPALVVVLAVDLPLLTGGTVRRLLAAGSSPDGDGAVLVDADGRRQHLCAAYRTGALVGGPETHGTSVRALVGDLDLVEVPAEGDETRDLDTWADLADLREVVARERPARED